MLQGALLHVHMQGPPLARACAPCGKRCNVPAPRRFVRPKSRAFVGVWWTIAGPDRERKKAAARAVCIASGIAQIRDLGLEGWIYFCLARG